VAINADATTKPGPHLPTAAPPRSARKAPAPFPTTSRWLRGRIVDQLRSTEGDGWSRIEGPIGDHDHAAVVAAIEALARDGVVELDRAPTGRAGERSPALRARLPVS
jgi:hypothetical protein